MQTKPRQAVVWEGRNRQFISDVHYDSLGARVVRNKIATAYMGLCQYDNNRKVSLTTALKSRSTSSKIYRKTKAMNDKNILRNAARMLYADPCRRIMFGITIANTTVRLWYFSRAVVFVSSPFNFISFTQEHKHFIYYIISMSFGNLQDLGYDTSVVRPTFPINTSKKKYRVQYDYFGNTYRSLGSLRLSGLVFRATRGREFVLKHV
ncbi:hypothetical protein ARMGADRAFT_242215 [Armillaria gallica]|uniref:Fungal-type protein kinase domain-containing protein n=1 Tax=Armillaria gallica TaxID=47427 RepID=A0A2H3E748_ARMGA|nr:hypothetical protein ARMGADRAFT_242215 [Armillaria gallica]